MNYWTYYDKYDKTIWYGYDDEITENINHSNTLEKAISNQKKRIIHEQELLKELEKLVSNKDY